MKYLFSSDSYKGTISSARIADILTESAKKINPDIETVGLPIADGGEGTVDAVLEANSGTRCTVKVHNPLMEETEASYGLFNLPWDSEDSGLSAIIEMSAASGITLISPETRNPLNTSTYGTGELIRDAVLRGCRKITIAIGGSSTNDGGIGAMQALGIRFLDAEGNELTAGTGSELSKIAAIDTRSLLPEIRETDITVLCDVDNKLTGPDGATFTFGRQKCSPNFGDDEINEILSELEAGMCNYAEILRLTFGLDPDSIPGAGAAGGLGAALSIMLGARMNSGIETVLDIISFDSYLKDVDICITGEGCLDWQSSHGKTITGIVAHCKAHNIPVIALVGSTGVGYEDAYEIGLSKIFRVCDEAPSIDESINNAEYFYRIAAEKMFRTLSEN